MKILTSLMLVLTIKGAVLSNPINNSSVIPECLTNEECPSDKACVVNQCVDPCVGRCGKNTDCNVRENIPACSCSPGYSGHPFAVDGCSPTTIPRLLPGINGHIVMERGIKRFHAEGTFRMNWYEAYMHCRSKGQQLATIHSKQENDQVLEEIKTTQAFKDTPNYLFWVAGTDMGNEGVWYWMSTGMPISGFTDWHTDQPDNADKSEDCLGFSDRNVDKWHDAKCTLECYFVCESYE